MKRVRVWYENGGFLAEVIGKPEVKLNRRAGTQYGAVAQLLCLFPEEFGVEIQFDSSPGPRCS